MYKKNYFLFMKYVRVVYKKNIQNKTYILKNCQKQNLNLFGQFIIPLKKVFIETSSIATVKKTKTISSLLYFFI